MPRYYFSVRNGRQFDDVDGLELPDEASARAEAKGFARDLMRMEPERRDWSNWVVSVSDGEGRIVFSLLFTDIQ